MRLEGERGERGEREKREVRDTDGEVEVWAGKKRDEDKQKKTGHLGVDKQDRGSPSLKLQREDIPELE